MVDPLVHSLQHGALGSFRWTSRCRACTACSFVTTTSRRRSPRRRLAVLEAFEFLLALRFLVITLPCNKGRRSVHSDIIKQVLEQVGVIWRSFLQLPPLWLFLQSTQVTKSGNCESMTSAYTKHNIAYGTLVFSFHQLSGAVGHPLESVPRPVSCFIFLMKL